MRTSPRQFKTLVKYMEMYGDLSRPTGSLIRRKCSLERWEELCRMLNADQTGDPKVVEKWKKVWSDFKLNTKKKEARLKGDINGKGGGPTSSVKLSVLEERVLHIIRSKLAVGLTGVVEAGLPPMEEAAPDIPSPQFDANSIEILRDDCLWEVEEPSQEQNNFNATLLGLSNADTARNVDAASSVNAARIVFIDDAGLAVPDRLSGDGPVRPVSAGSARSSGPNLARLPRHTRGARGRTPRRRHNTGNAAQKFLNTYAAHLAFEREHWQRLNEIEAERNAIMERRLELMRIQNDTMNTGWQRIANRALDILEKYLNK